MNPKPPTWISSRIATWPNGLQCVAVSTTTRPVTHTAEVAVNAASTSGVQVPSADEIGSISTTVPIAIRTANPVARIVAGERERRAGPRPEDERAGSQRVRPTAVPARGPAAARRGPRTRSVTRRPSRAPVVRPLRPPSSRGSVRTAESSLADGKGVPAALRRRTRVRGPTGALRVPRRATGRRAERRVGTSRRARTRGRPARS